MRLKGTGKRGPFDFVLWRATADAEEGWESPWGIGRPGWHTECVAMAMDSLGPTLDVHWGGKDLIYPHHECEALIAKALTGGRFVGYWMHNEFVLLAGEKMSKSTGRTILIRDVLKEYPPEALRMLILSQHYRQRVEYDDSAITMAREDYMRLREAARRAEGWRNLGGMSDSVRDYAGLFFAALEDDLQTGQALSVAERLSFEILGGGSGDAYAGAHRLYDAVEDILGLRLYRRGPQPMSTQ